MKVQEKAIRMQRKDDRKIEINLQTLLKYEMKEKQR